jgi:hypothetical protein
MNRLLPAARIVAAACLLAAPTAVARAQDNADPAAAVRAAYADMLRNKGLDGEASEVKPVAQQVDSLGSDLARKLEAIKDLRSKADSARRDVENAQDALGRYGAQYRATLDDFMTKKAALQSECDAFEARYPAGQYDQATLNIINAEYARLEAKRQRHNDAVKEADEKAKARAGELDRALQESSEKLKRVEKQSEDGVDALAEAQRVGMGRIDGELNKLIEQRGSAVAMKKGGAWGDAVHALESSAQAQRDGDAGRARRAASAAFDGGSAGGDASVPSGYTPPAVVTGSPAYQRAASELPELERRIAEQKQILTCADSTPQQKADAL